MKNTILVLDTKRVHRERHASRRYRLLNGYAPTGATVSAAKDLTILATAPLDGTAPGMQTDRRGDRRRRRQPARNQR